MMQPPHIAPNLSWQLPTLLDLEGPGMTDEGQNFHVYRDNDQTSSGASDSFEHISGTHQSDGRGVENVAGGSVDGIEADVNTMGVHNEVNNLAYTFQDSTKVTEVPTNEPQTNLLNGFIGSLNKAAQSHAFRNFTEGPSPTRVNPLTGLHPTSELNLSETNLATMKNNAESSMTDFDRTTVYPAMTAVVDRYAKQFLANQFGYSGELTPQMIQKLARQVLKFGYLINSFEIRNNESQTSEPVPEAATKPSPLTMETELPLFTVGYEHSHLGHNAEAARRMPRLEKSAIIRGFPATSDKRKVVVKVGHFNHPLLYAVMNAGITKYLTHFPHLRTMYNSKNPLPPSALAPPVGIISEYWAQRSSGFFSLSTIDLGYIGVMRLLSTSLIVDFMAASDEAPRLFADMQGFTENVFITQPISDMDRKEYSFNSYYPQDPKLFSRINPGLHLHADDQQGHLQRERANTIVTASRTSTTPKDSTAPEASTAPGTFRWNPRNMPPPPTIPTKAAPAAVREGGWSYVGTSSRGFNDLGEGGSGLSGAGRGRGRGRM